MKSNFLIHQYIISFNHYNLVPVTKNTDHPYQNKKIYKYKQNKEISGQISFHMTCVLSAMFDVLRASSTNNSVV